MYINNHNSFFLINFFVGKPINEISEITVGQILSSSEINNNNDLPKEFIIASSNDNWIVYIKDDDNNIEKKKFDSYSTKIRKTDNEIPHVIIKQRKFGKISSIPLIPDDVSYENIETILVVPENTIINDNK